jgi:hypothetical protein
MSLRSERRFISKQTIKSGMLVEFDYIPDGSASKGNYQVLIIDPSKYNNGKQYLHGILTADLSDFDVISLITKLGNLKLDPDERDMPLSELANDLAYANYKQYIKKERRYRTFLIDNIKTIKQILIGELT